MPLSDGFVSKREATKIIPRSSRQLTRDIHGAITIGDSDVLSCFALATGDGNITSAADIANIEFIKQLKEDGKAPSWYVHAENYKSILGRRATAKSTPIVDEQTPKKTSIDSISPPKEETNETPHFDYVKHLEKRIEQLEQEKQQEIDRAEREQERAQRREDQLNAQLVVKDKQISSWDELTQGLAKGLATGQLRPGPDANTIVQADDTDRPIAKNEKSQKPVPAADIVDSQVEKTNSVKKAVSKTAKSKKNSSQKKAKSSTTKKTKNSKTKNAGSKTPTKQEKNSTPMTKKKGFWSLFGPTD